MQTIFPILRYNDARGAIRSLCATSGFVELFAVPESGQIDRHAQQFGRHVIMLGFVRPFECNLFGSSTRVGDQAAANSPHNIHHTRVIKALKIGRKQLF